ncbi:MAG: ABC transporter substrate-binding protein [Actinomycetota bacterium]
MRRTLSFVLAAALSLGAAACGDARTAGTQPVATGSFPVTVQASSGPLMLPAKPIRIVSLSPSSTEILFAIGAGEQVVAVDDQSNYPRTAPKTSLSGFEPNIEAIASYRPDLVVFSNGAIAEKLAALSIPGLFHDAAASLDDTYRQITELGQATGHTGDAAKVVADMRSKIAEISDAVGTVPGEPSYYHELDSTYFSVTSKTFIGRVYALLGLKNIADAADAQNTGYPQLSAEYIIQANPSLIFLADTKCCGQSAATVAKRAGWDKIGAVKGGHVIALDDDIASRWGPRIVDFLRTVATALDALPAAA